MKQIEGYQPINNANAVAAANPKWKLKQPIWFWICCLLGIRVNATEIEGDRWKR